MKEILVLAPIDDLYHKAKKIIAEQKYSNVDLLHGNMSQGVKAAREAVAQGTKIIVTRGGTYQVVKEQLQIPVVEIKVGAYDLIECFKKVREQKQTIGIVGYRNVIYGVELLKEILPHNLKIIEIKQEEDIIQVIRLHKDRGIQSYIGDANIIPIINNLGCEGILINSQEATMLLAIQEARRIVTATKEEKRRARQILTMTDFIHDGIIAVDEAERITVFNKTAENIFETVQREAIGRKISDVIPSVNLPRVLRTGEPEIGELQQVKKYTITINHIPIMVDGEAKGAVATFQDVTEVQNIEQKIRRSLNGNGFIAKYNFSDIIYASEQIKECVDAAREYAQYDIPVHICGESGVGKEFFCQSMHNSSPRRKGPFVAINCAAIPPTLIESELFGYAKGSFTGADRDGRPGIFELAHNGTLFLDEINEIPMALQGRLLRILQERQVMRVGGNKIIPIDVKVVTASNQYLRRLMEEGKFRKDLFFRINILTLRIPSLDKRREDIPVLCSHFIHKHANRYSKEPLEIPPACMEILMRRKYEGNVRELEGIIQRCIILSSFNSLLTHQESTASLPKNIEKMVSPVLWAEDEMDLSTMECKYIQSVYSKTGEDIKQTCEILGISRTTLWRKLKEKQ